MNVSMLLLKFLDLFLTSLESPPPWSHKSTAGMPSIMLVHTVCFFLQLHEIGTNACDAILSVRFPAKSAS